MNNMAWARKMGFPALGKADRLLGIGRHLIGTVRIKQQMGQCVEHATLQLEIPASARQFEHAVKIRHGPIEAAQGLVGRAGFCRMVASRSARSASGSFATRPSAWLKCSSASGLA